MARDMTEVFDLLPAARREKIQLRAAQLLEEHAETLCGDGPVDIALEDKTDPYRN